METKSIKWTSFLFLLFIGYYTPNVYANPIDRETAKMIVQKQINNHSSRAIAKSQKGEKTEISFVMEGEEQTFYVFNIGDDEGFVVVSGDDATDEILMSCSSGHFISEEMPDNMMAWLKGYSKQIKWLRDNGITKEMNRRKAGSFDKYYKLEDDPKKAERLARWDQSGIYGKDRLFNYGFPKVSNEKGVETTAVTGCTITAVAQFLYYHQWPKEIGPKSIPSYTTKTNKLVREGYEVGTTIDWDHIYRTYDQSESYSEEERNAISGLMKMVGAAYKTDYKYGGSSSSLSNTPAVLQDYFNYNEMEFTDKLKDEDEWLQMIYDELTTNGPVLYRGYDKDEEGSHSFLIVGIDGDYVWVNWGWGRLTSTYTKLSACNNDFNDYVFDKEQRAVFGVSPNRTGKRFDLKVLTSALLAKAGKTFTRNSFEDDFEEILLQYTYTNIFDDATFDIGFLVENTETCEQTFYSLFSRTLKGLKTTTSNLKFSFGKNLNDGIYRIYGASREYGSNEFHANYNKTSQYIEVTISGNKLYIGREEDHQNASLLDYTYAAGSEYRLYGQVDYTDSRTNPDGVVFYRTDLLLDIKKDGKTKTYVVDRGNIYNSATYENMMFPCLMLDLENDRMYVFHNSKDDDEYYGMKGYVYSSPISSVHFTRETVYEHFNCGWYPYFMGLMDNGYPALHHFSYAGYYEMISLYNGSEWETYFVSSMDPSDAAKDGKSHSPFLVLGENRVSDHVAEYCTSEQDENSYKILSVDSNVSGDFTIPEEVSGTPVNSIASYAFSTCDDITSITIPESITSIEEFAFGSSRNLTSIKVMSAQPIDLSYSYETGESGEGDDSENRFVMTPFELVDKSTCVLYVPRGSREAYALAVGWGDFQNIEEHDDVSSGTVLQGDINNDKEVNVTDVVTLISYIAKNDFSSVDKNTLDLNGDGNVDVTDVVTLILMIATLK